MITNNKGDQPTYKALNQHHRPKSHITSCWLQTGLLAREEILADSLAMPDRDGSYKEWEVWIEPTTAMILEVSSRAVFKVIISYQVWKSGRMVAVIRIHNEQQPQPIPVLYPALGGN